MTEFNEPCNMPERSIRAIRCAILLVALHLGSGHVQLCAQETLDRTGRFVGVYFEVEKAVNSVCQDAQVLIKRAGDRNVFEQMERDFMRERKGKGDSRANAIFLEPDKPALVFEYPMYSHGFSCARTGVEVLTGRPLDELREEAVRIKSEAIRKFPEAIRPSDGLLLVHWENSGAVTKTFSYVGPLEIRKTYDDSTLIMIRVSSKHTDGLLPVLIEREQVRQPPDPGNSEVIVLNEPPVTDKYLLSPGGQLILRIFRDKAERVTIKHAEQAIPEGKDIPVIDLLKGWIRAYLFDPFAPVEPLKLSTVGVRG